MIQNFLPGSRMLQETTKTRPWPSRENRALGMWLETWYLVWWQKCDETVTHYTLEMLLVKRGYDIGEHGGKNSEHWHLLAASWHTKERWTQMVVGQAAGPGPGRGSEVPTTHLRRRPPCPCTTLRVEFYVLGPPCPPRHPPVPALPCCKHRGNKGNAAFLEEASDWSFRDKLTESAIIWRLSWLKRPISFLPQSEALLSVCHKMTALTRDKTGAPPAMRASLLEKMGLRISPWGRDKAQKWKIDATLQLTKLHPDKMSECRHSLMRLTGRKQNRIH